MSGNYTIYHGHIWIDYTNGRHILTLAPVPAGLLQAAIPLFISMVGMALWTIVKRVWYHYSLRWGMERIQASTWNDNSRYSFATAAAIPVCHGMLFVSGGTGDATVLGCIGG
jgi:hypothetical protein